jgi:Putative amidoligase enzyme
MKASLPRALRGLCYRESQTFGIEFELAPKRGELPAEDSTEWLRIATAIADALKHRLPTGGFGAVHAEYVGSERGTKSPAHWNVEYDDTTGWEVTTRVLAGVEGFCEVDAACRALAQVAAENDLCVDARTGTHVHFGWSGDIEQLKRTVELVKLFEPVLGSLVAPSRIAQLTDGRYDLDAPNPYSRPVSAVLNADALRDLRLFSDVTRLTNGDDDLRYVTFNVRPLDYQQTVEVRLHHGTLEPHKILRWISLWQQILWAAEHPRRELEPVPDVQVITPNPDLISLAREYLVPIEQPGQREFLELLRQDQCDVVERHWKPHPELAPWVDGLAY